MAKNSFVQTLIDAANGRMAEQLDQKFSDLVAAVKANGGKGKITINLMVGASGYDANGNVNQVDLEHKVTITKPEKATGKAIFFIDDKDRLTRQDPRQMELDNAIGTRKEVKQ